MAFLDRQQLLQFLYDRLPDKSKVRLGKRVNKIQLSDSGVNVFTTDGDEFSGHLAAGADGVHSVTRSEMWRNADLLQPNLISDEEKSGTSLITLCLAVLYFQKK